MIGSARVRVIALGLALVPATIALAAAKPVHKPAASADWTRTFAVTPEGGFRMGNANAKIAVVEYGSLTCPHCRHMADVAVKPLIANYVRTGEASYEYRSMVLNGIDLAATLVARCRGAAQFFPIADKLYATQSAWVGKVHDQLDSRKDELQALAPAERLTRIAEAGGLIAIARTHGITPAKAQACLKDEAASEQLAEMYQAALERGVEGTPTFYVNGKQVVADDWAALEEQLKNVGS